MGKAIKESKSEVEKCAWAIEYFADNGKSFLNDEIINTDARKTFVTFQPIGVIGSIMPWNFPYWQALRFAAPSLMVGNTIVLKPASATMQCGLEIQEAFTNAGIPDGVFQTIIGDSSVAENLIDSQDINAVIFTGSVSTGGKVAQRATSQIKKCVLELGGKLGTLDDNFQVIALLTTRLIDTHFDLNIFIVSLLHYVPIQHILRKGLFRQRHGLLRPYYNCIYTFTNKISGERIY